MSDQEPIAVAVLAALNGITGVDAYDIDEVPGTNGLPGPVPARYVVISLTRILTDVARASGEEVLHGYLLDTTYRAQNVSQCRELRRLVSAALESQAVGAYGPFVFNDESQPIDDDPDWKFSGVDTWSFC